MITQALAWVEICGAGLGLLLLCLFHGAYERLRSAASSEAPTSSATKPRPISG